MNKYYKAEDVVRKIAKQKRFEAILDNDDAPTDIEPYITEATLFLIDISTIEVSEDCISREWIYDALLEYGFTAPDMTATKLIEEAPSVVPITEQSSMVGEWYRQTTDHFDYWECSECGMGVGLDDIKNYCPNCGAKMKGVDDE